MGDVADQKEALKAGLAERPATPAVTHQGARNAVRKQIEETIFQEQEVSFPGVARKVAHWLRGQSELLWAYQGERIYGEIYREVLECGRMSRGGRSTGAIAQQAAGFKSRFQTWMEHSGDRHIKLLSMTKGDLLVAAEEREQRAGVELSWAKLWRTLADGLEEGQQVGNRFTVAEIEAVRRSLGLPDAVDAITAGAN